MHYNISSKNVPTINKYWVFIIITRKKNLTQDKVFYTLLYFGISLVFAGEGGQLVVPLSYWEREDKAVSE